MGTEVSRKGQIISLKSGASRLGCLANGGVCDSPRAVINGSSRPATRRSLEDDIIPAAMASGQRLFGIEFPGTFIDIGIPGDYQRAPALLST